MKSRLPQEFQGGNANMNQMVRKAQKMQEDITRVQEEIEAKEFTKQVGGGAMELVMTGDKKLKSVTLKPEAVDPDDIETMSDITTCDKDDSRTILLIEQVQLQALRSEHRIDYAIVGQDKQRERHQTDKQEREQTN